MGRQSIVDYFVENIARMGSRTAALVKTDGVYKAVTWSELGKEVEILTAGLIDLGVAVGDRVCVMAQSSVEWVIADLSILSAGAVTVPIYQSNLPDECQFIVDDAGATYVIAEDDAQVQKFRRERGRLTSVKKIVQMRGAVSEKDGWVIPWADVRKTNPDSEAITNRRKTLSGDSILTIIYTSGTTGRPKGVVITHDNMLYEGEAIAQIDLVSENDIQLFFLPLAHSFAKVAEIAWLSTHHIIAFAENMQTLRENMSEVRPTLMAGVPRVFEKFYSAVMHKGSSGSGVARLLFARAVTLSQRNGECEAQGNALPWRERLEFMALKPLVFRKVGAGLRESMGGRMRVLVSGGAPLSPKIAWFFRDAGIDILEGFGLTETCAATCVNRLNRNRIGTVGLPLPGTELRLDADGELLIKGRGVMREYWQHPDATREVLQEGWFRTGDIAKIDADGSVRIVDRKKDLIVTAGGKNVSPQNVENLLKTDKLISQVVVHGDKRNFLTALITLDVDVLKEFAAHNNLGNGSYAELTQRPEVRKAVQAVIDGFNKQLPSYETIKKFKVLEHDFSQESGELTPSLKIKRKVVSQRYRTTFDGFYEETY